MRKIQLLILSLAIVFFSACSSKRVYEPKSTSDDWEKYGTLEESLIDVTSNVALLENRKVLTKSELIDVEVPQEYRILAHTDDWIISSTIDGKLKLQQVDAVNIVEDFELKKTIASASANDDTLAVLFADNEMALYSIASKKLLLKEQGADALAVDARIINPHFMKDLVIFATLDGKIIIINAKTKKKLRTVIVSSEDNFNNIIYFNIIQNKIVAATAYKILVMGEKEVRQKYEIRNVATDGKNIFITTKQGEIVSLTTSLDVNAKLKLPFAHFMGLIVKNEKVFVLEKEGYLIEAPADLSTFSVHEAEIEDGYIFTADTKFFMDDEYLSVE